MVQKKLNVFTEQNHSFPVTLDFGLQMENWTWIVTNEPLSSQLTQVFVSRWQGPVWSILRPLLMIFSSCHSTDMISSSDEATNPCQRNLGSNCEKMAPPRCFWCCEHSLSRTTLDPSVWEKQVQWTTQRWVWNIVFSTFHFVQVFFHLWGVKR